MNFGLLLTELQGRGYGWQACAFHGVLHFAHERHDGKYLVHSQVSPFTENIFILIADRCSDSSYQDGYRPGGC